MEGNNFTEKKVSRHVFRRSVCEARAAFADVSPEELQKKIDDAVKEVRERNRGTHSVNYNP